MPVAIHLPDKDAVREHFTAMMRAYREQNGAAVWVPREVEAHALGEFSSFATVHWNALNEAGEVVRDTYTTYHLLETPPGLRFLSYTNHF